MDELPTCPSPILMGLIWISFKNVNESAIFNMSIQMHLNHSNLFLFCLVLFFITLLFFITVKVLSNLYISQLTVFWFVIPINILYGTMSCSLNVGSGSTYPEAEGGGSRGNMRQL